ncbi:Bromodomain containing protein 7 [Saguinus oedipus]|uniref:Bromodomain containing protein 7 n=1 Tax=Saguinus oedipus TaxID=9490 RepID=A0ABQ9WCQ3_SAGOE|nr:Bromodomain containing protein 7 [Saguinus oedipus]
MQEKIKNNDHQLIEELTVLNAPHYDSTFANISLDDSDLIYSSYREDSDLPSDFSIHEFLITCQDYPYVMADSLLNVLTKGGHSRTLQELEMSLPEDEGHTRTLDTAKEMEITEKEPAGHLDFNTQDRLIAVRQYHTLAYQLKFLTLKKLKHSSRNLMRPSD